MFGTQVQNCRVTFPADEDAADGEDAADEAGDEPDEAAGEDEDEEQPAATRAARAAPAIAAVRTCRLASREELAGAGRAWEKSFIAPPGRGRWRFISGAAGRR